MYVKHKRIGADCVFLNIYLQCYLVQLATAHRRITIQRDYNALTYTWTLVRNICTERRRTATAIWKIRIYTRVPTRSIELN